MNLFLAFVLLGQLPLTSSFNSYAAHLEPHVTSNACRIHDPKYLGNITYEFRAMAYPGQRAVPFKDGRYVERASNGRDIEWSTELERQDAIELAGNPAVLLAFLANHVGGSGSASHVLIMRCRGKRLETVFEVGGEGVRFTYSAPSDLEISHPLWRQADSHASPSQLIVEQYRWEPTRDQFVLVRRAETEKRHLRSEGS